MSSSGEVATACPFQAMWDQRTTLKPPPFTGAMARLLRGLNEFDTPFDDLPIHIVQKGAKDSSLVEQDAEPDWVDWDSVARGQQLFAGNIGPAFVALNVSLLHGFSIARFAEVLVDSGYARSAETSWDRYSHTAWHISDWYRFSLQDRDSIARRSIYQVSATSTNSVQC
jgi:hypothetical protein